MNKSIKHLPLEMAKTMVDQKNQVLIIYDLIPSDFYVLYQNNLIKEIIVISVEKETMEAIVLLDKIQFIGHLNMEVLTKLRKHECNVNLTAKAKAQMKTMLE